MNTDLRTYNRRIVEKDKRYLTHAERGRPAWHWSPYHAWWDAENGGQFVPEIAKKVGGKVRTFNPVTGVII